MGSGYHLFTQKWSLTVKNFISLGVWTAQTQKPRFSSHCAPQFSRAYAYKWLCGSNQQWEAASPSMPEASVLQGLLLKQWGTEVAATSFLTWTGCLAEQRGEEMRRGPGWSAERFRFQETALGMRGWGKWHHSAWRRARGGVTQQAKASHLSVPHLQRLAHGMQCRRWRVQVNSPRDRVCKHTFLLGLWGTLIFKLH